MAHQAPNSKDDVSLTAIKDSGLVPDDYWTHPEWYQSQPEERESFAKVTAAMASSKQRLWVYRAVPKSVKDAKIRNGDWVTPSRDYARNEGQMIPEGYRLIAQRVDLKDVYWDGNSMAELGYDDGKNYAYANTKNNRKLVDVITRDDDGNIIPLSKRFNKRSDDSRYSRSSTRRAGQQKVGAVLGREAAERAASRIGRRLGLSANVSIRTVDTEAELPADIRAQAAKDGATGTVIAVHRGDEIFLVADQHKSLAQVEESILHESNHYGANALFGKAKRQAYTRLYFKLGRADGIRDLAAKQGVNMDAYFTTADELRKDGKISDTQRFSYLVDEFLAHVQGKKAYASLPQKIKTAIQEFYGAIRNWMNQRGFVKLAQFNDADLAYLLRSIHRAAQGNTQPGKGQAMFMRSWAESAEGGKTAPMTGSTNSLRLYRGDSVNTDGIGRGSVGDLGKGYYFVADRLVAEYFTDGSNAEHVRGSDVSISNPFDLMDRNIAANPSWQSMMKTVPDGLTKQQLERWARNDLDVRNTYGFLARSFGQTVETFNDFLAEHGFDAVVDQGVRGVSDTAKQYVVFDKGQIDGSGGAQFSRAPTINVDGQERPTTNSNGQLIHSTEEGVQNFWRWMNGGMERGGVAQAGQGRQEYGGGQGADGGDSTGRRSFFSADGRPHVYFHGTGDNVKAFQVGHRNRKDSGWLGRGIYVTNTPSVANTYANIKSGDGDPNVMPLYVGLRNPYVADLKFKKMMSKLSVDGIDAQ
jgi:hypothetical protein